MTIAMPAVSVIAEAKSPIPISSTVVAAVSTIAAKMLSVPIPPNSVQMKRNGTSETTSSAGSAAATGVAAGHRVADVLERTLPAVDRGLVATTVVLELPCADVLGNFLHHLGVDRLQAHLARVTARVGLARLEIGIARLRQVLADA